MTLNECTTDGMERGLVAGGGYEGYTPHGMAGWMIIISFIVHWDDADSLLPYLNFWMVFQPLAFAGEFLFFFIFCCCSLKKTVKTEPIHCFVPRFMVVRRSTKKMRKIKIVISFFYDLVFVFFSSAIHPSVIIVSPEPLLLSPSPGQQSILTFSFAVRT